MNKFKDGDKVLVHGRIAGTSYELTIPREGVIKYGHQGNWHVTVLPCPEFPKGDYWWLKDENLTPYQQSPFKVGDKIRIKKYEPHPSFAGSAGIVCNLSSYYVTIKADSSPNGHANEKLCFALRDTEIELVCTKEDIGLVNELEKPVFKVGDRIRITAVTHDKNNRYIGQTGTVTEPMRNDGVYPIEIDGNDWPKMFLCRPVNMQLLSSQSPQPTTNQTSKEEYMKPFAVIQHDLSGGTQASITGYYTTETEAKKAAEVSVARLRSNLQAKNYFAITIVNTETGKLVGSVVDAPPAVEWTKE